MESVKPVETMDAGYQRILKHLYKKGYKILDTIPINQGRYKILKTDKENLLVMFKREPFRNFGRQFSHLGLSGVGDTINVEDLKACIVKEVKRIYTIFPTGYIYSIPLKEFLIKSIKWITKEGKWVRSMSIHNYERENQDENSN